MTERLDPYIEEDRPTLELRDVNTVALHQRMMRNGWMIPHSMANFFAPIEHKPDSAPDGRTDAQLSNELLTRQLKLKDREKVLDAMKQLGAVREC